MGLFNSSGNKSGTVPDNVEASHLRHIEKMAEKQEYIRAREFSEIYKGMLQNYNNVISPHYAKLVRIVRKLAELEYKRSNPIPSVEALTKMNPRRDEVLKETKMYMDAFRQAVHEMKRAEMHLMSSISIIEKHLMDEKRVDRLLAVMASRYNILTQYQKAQIMKMRNKHLRFLRQERENLARERHELAHLINEEKDTKLSALNAQKYLGYLKTYKDKLDALVTRMGQDVSGIKRLDDDIVSMIRAEEEESIEEQKAQRRVA